MPDVDGKKDFVTWRDVMEHIRWLEAGYRRRVRFVGVVACPKGEQWPKFYWEAVLCDDNLQPIALPERALGSFPNATSKTLPGMFLGMLFALDNIAQPVSLWVDPQHARSAYAER